MRPGQHGLYRRETPVDQAIQAGLRRAGLTLEQAYRAAKVNHSTIARWRGGGAANWPTLKRFADAILATELFDLVPCSGRPVALSCPHCSRERVFPLYTIRSEQARGHLKGIVTKNGRGVADCASCTAVDKAYAMATATRARIIKKRGHKGLSERGRRARRARLWEDGKSAASSTTPPGSHLRW